MTLSLSKRQCKLVKEHAAPVIDTCDIYSVLLKSCILTVRCFCIMEPITCICFLFVSFLYLLANVSRQNCNVALVTITVLLHVSLQDSNHPESASILQSIPQNVWTVVRSLGIEPKTQAFVCCLNCFCTYSSESCTL